MLSQRYQALLIEAAQSAPEVRNQRIEEATKFIKAQNPEHFFHDVNGKPDPALKARVFHDEPRNLDYANYASFVVPYKGIEQAKMYEQRKAI